ncbi:hypothetical protein JKF63_03672 [Porcisia hertigi]|uniref:Uncharacterized protein n=1 Tax=Porcisia hertigi TaxID=2761500 RepID=A0A836HIM7_9TRYP|nr:hypothetical protein JKF63_03672 [Porcisia hertigi]
MRLPPVSLPPHSRQRLECLREAQSAQGTPTLCGIGCFVQPAELARGAASVDFREYTRSACPAFSHCEDDHTVSAGVAPPRYVAHVLVDQSSNASQRAVLPFSFVLVDVNEDCAAELLYAVRDSQARLHGVYVLSSNGRGVSAATDNVSAFISAFISASFLLMLQLLESYSRALRRSLFTRRREW